jgi:hypothetical protein
MSDFENHLSSSIDNEELALSKYEDELERIIQDNLTNGQDLYTQKLFRGKIRKLLFLLLLFLFLERSNGTNNWNTFHAAAESVTMLYKGI